MVGDKDRVGSWSQSVPARGQVLRPQRRAGHFPQEETGCLLLPDPIASREDQPGLSLGPEHGSRPGWSDCTGDK